jgi:hypothetical protein
MPEVPLITSGDPEAAAREEGEVTGAPGDGSCAAEETTGPTTEEECVDRATGPSVEVERTEAAEEVVPPAPASPGVASVPEVHSAPVPDEAVAAAIITEENAEADASEAGHVAELEAALLAASSPGREDPAEPAADGAVALIEAPVVTEEAEVRSAPGLCNNPGI